MKMNEFISSSEAEVLKSNPTDKFQKNIINTLNTFTEKLPNKPNIYHLRLMNPQPPILYGLPKLHKTNYPLRPVVSYINTPTYKICKYLNDLLKDMVISKFSIKNSFELTKNLQNLNIQNTDKLISFDVKKPLPFNFYPRTKNNIKSNYPFQYS